MAGDYSRDSFDIRHRYAAVMMQQGRVQIDADWNEQGDILLERMRRQALDTFGRVAASRFSTPDAFRIGVIPGSPRDLSIEPGRYYVDGLVAEALPSDGSPIRYTAQPFYPDPPPLPDRTGAIVYLDVWQREVTWVEEPALLDVALGGVDTAARLQTAWQVKVAAEPNATCGIDLDVRFPPSPARLTTAAIAPPAPEDPCLIAPKVGYRGIENRLYRVEVHRGGPAGTARFKYSRDNASVRSPVLGMTTELRGGSEVSVLVVERIGLDPGLRFSAGEWVEITDEHRFLHGEAGAMAQIAEPPTERTGEDGFRVVLDRRIPAAGERAFGASPAALAIRRTRIIRWDQAAPRNTLDADGLMTIGAAATPLEEGIEVTFSLAAPGAQYRVGDYWVFAARTADASVEVLAAAPPKGPIHRYAQLAAFSQIATGDAPSDCRTLWPPLTQGGGDGCCTVVVRPGEDVQAAIDSLPPAGGCVCLKAGLHELRDALRITRSRVSLHAEAPGAAVLRRASAAPVIQIGGGGLTAAQPTDVTIEGIVVQLGSLIQDDRPRTAFEALLMISEATERVRVIGCDFSVQDVAGRLAGIATAGREVTIERCTIERLTIGIVATEGTADLSIRDCLVTARSRSLKASSLTEVIAGEDTGAAGIAVLACEGSARVENNVVLAHRYGIVLGDPGAERQGIASPDAVIAHNVVVRGAPAEIRDEPAPPPAPPPQPGPAPVPPTPPVAPGRPIVGPTPVITPRGPIAGMTRRIDALAAGLAARAERMSLDERDLAAVSAVSDSARAAAESLAAAEAVGRSALAAQPTASAVLAPGQDRPALAILAAAENCIVIENLIGWRSQVYGGIGVENGVRLVAGNDLYFLSDRQGGRVPIEGGQPGTQPEPGAVLTIGIVAGMSGNQTGITNIADNVLIGPLVAISLSATAGVRAARNVIVNPLIGILVNGGEGTIVEQNLISRGQSGIGLLNTARPVLRGNVIDGTESDGIVAFFTGSMSPGPVRISGNTLRACGRGQDQANGLRVIAADPQQQTGAWFEQTEVILEHNTVLDTGFTRGTGQRAARSVEMSVAAPRVVVHGNDLGRGQPTRSDPGLNAIAQEIAKTNRALVVMPLAAQGFPMIDQDVWAHACTLTDNRMRGFSVDTLAEIVEGPVVEGQRAPRFHSVVVTGNTVEHWRPAQSTSGRATVELRALSTGLVTVTGNVVRGPGRAPSVRIDGPQQIAFAGNATSGPLVGAAGPVNVLI